jgi:hypothetical protein
VQWTNKERLIEPFVLSTTEPGTNLQEYSVKEDSISRAVHNAFQ